METTIDPAKPIYASRNAGKDSGVWRDEDVAMAHEQYGPFTGADAVGQARAALSAAMRSEADHLDRVGNGDWAATRAAQIRTGADQIDAGADRAEAGGLVFKISNYAW